MTTEELQRELLKIVAVSHRWMLKALKDKEDDMGFYGNYSDELRGSIEVQKLLDEV